MNEIAPAENMTVIKHKHRRDMPVTSILSRLFPTGHDNMEETFEAYIHIVISSLPVLDKKMTAIRVATVCWLPTVLEILC